ALRQPPYLTYTLEAQSLGLRVDFTHDQAHRIWLNIHSGSLDTTWQMRHQTDDFASEIIDEKGKRYVSKRAFFDPTWFSAYHALRDGMLNYQPPERAISTLATPPPETASTLHSIGMVSVMGPTIYQIVDRGAALCPQGNPGHALHLISRDRLPNHQLSDVIVDDATKRFCMIRFGIADAFGFHGVVEQYYGESPGGYWLQTGGLMDGTMRAFGISMHHGKWLYRLTHLQFPSSIPDDAFALPPDQ
ncbi:MAG: hypothetical protein M3N19_03170, partial [Candidatus Eremiobacteraeota bacterium]|nr:hypothetical protein [Candidatus Eremiobacteraeota bacterium]